MDDEPLENTYATNKVYVDKHIKNSIDDFKESIDEKITTIIKDTSGSYLPLLGGTMLGDINFSDSTMTITSEPLNKQHVVNKGYVDNQNLAFKQYAEDLINKSIEEQTKTFLPLTGGTMSGDIIMANSKVTIEQHPSQANEGANKSYVDSQQTCLLYTSDAADD